DKPKANNQLAVISARQFTVEETKRYAGAGNDVSRMATNYAGVSAANDAVNDIVIRGNSPTGLLWQLEGIPIPNPNHFGNMGATGGPVSMLNNNVLANSDFITSAFPAEYGNATSGVFDLAMRNGNYEKPEFMGQVGFNGFELGAEGPIKRDNHSSYLINYRYSTLGLMADLGYDVGTGTAVPYYQDLTFKLHLPTPRMGTFDIFGLGGLNNIEFINSEKDETDDSESFYENDWMDLKNTNQMGVTGISHEYIFNKKTRYKATLAATHIANGTQIDSIAADRSTIDWYDVNMEENRVMAQAYVNHKFNTKHNVRLGTRITNIGYQLRDSLWKANLGHFQTQMDEDGNMQHLQSYLQWKYRKNDKLEFNSGLHYHYLTLDNQTALEPRLGIRYRLTPNQTVNLGYGLHSQNQPIQLYFNRVVSPSGTYIQPNKNLDFSKSHHMVAGYDWNLSEHLRIKAEVYYQHLYDIVIEQNASTYASLNNGSQVYVMPDSLTNGGAGQNMGAELTVERFLHKGFYYLGTLSVFDSKYKASDGVWRSTQFDSDYVLNLLGGKEFELFKNNTNRKLQQWLSVNVAFTAAGGKRYTPVDIESSMTSGQTEYDYDRAFSEQFDDYLRLDLCIAYRMDGVWFSQEWAFDIQNITDHKNPFGKQINLATGQEETTYQLGFFPMMNYRITF
nr:TonB-dependent receptor [Salinivirgaceae bacterium]